MQTILRIRRECHDSHADDLCLLSNETYPREFSHLLSEPLKLLLGKLMASNFSTRMHDSVIALDSQDEHLSKDNMYTTTCRTVCSSVTNTWSTSCFSPF